MRGAMASLSTMPARVPLTPEAIWQAVGIHRMVTRGCYIYFRIDEDLHIVTIIAVIYSKRDQVEQLLKTIPEN